MLSDYEREQKEHFHALWQHLEECHPMGESAQARVFGYKAEVIIHSIRLNFRRQRVDEVESPICHKDNNDKAARDRNPKARPKPDERQQTEETQYGQRP